MFTFCFVPIILNFMKTKRKSVNAANQNRTWNFGINKKRKKWQGNIVSLETIV
jgi:hypothetical protein